MIELELVEQKEEQAAGDTGTAAKGDA
jgi:hypothetical protein